MRTTLFFLFAMMVGGCTSEPVPIRYGTDACAFCKMTLVDARYGAEVITSKGKVLVFDDINCLMNAAVQHMVDTVNARHILVADMAAPNTLTDARTAHYLHSDALRTPMASGIAAFAQADACSAEQATTGGEVLNWPKIKERF
jgi:copper chaperone NosL